ncbi:SGNH/GDSL hydrolase family protein [Bradyrhizobium jicamae]|uniref:SGNH/GDSL hydrolase family protein n=1 Tax=Bradyrhizobium jicamae TaxID=280332 RepID=A0ABS5FCK7_9BRAD|nr:SGNH/GDSL hydrolase family protein [Bradyrhizobium jicamae]MBR0794519.1 SGNH/GDSL hydrolase family protein [Bradyrhizobium jicamae]MBR0933669.1 SGNH/GDSL hydrolase family protein [Bradyrhizobium jicamae]
MRCAVPFRRTIWRSVSAVAAIVLLSAAPLQAQTAQPDQHAALSAGAKAEAATRSDAAKSDAATPAAAAGDQAAPQAPGLTARAIDKVKQVAKSAGDIFHRVPCLAPKGVPNSTGSLPHVAAKLAEGRPVVIVAFGSSSTQGYGSSAPEFTYPNRLAAQLRRQYPTADISVLNRGKGGDDAPEMMKRLQSEVLDVHPDMVIWQVGTNAVLRNLDQTETEKEVADGVARIQAGGSDVVLVDPQYSPRVTERPESARGMVKLLGRIAALRHVGIFPRFEVMRDWHEKQAIPINDFVIADGLHMNDWGYACFAQLLGDDIIRSVGQVKLGVNVPAETRTYRPM